ncbi:hypothetical protein KM043_000102, partial [Ampulex compressa]
MENNTVDINAIKRVREGEENQDESTSSDEEIFEARPKKPKRGKPQERLQEEPHAPQSPIVPESSSEELSPAPEVSPSQNSMIPHPTPV